MKQTTLDWLESELIEYLYFCAIESVDKDTRFIKIDVFRLKGFFNKAKQMEKEQIEDAFEYGWSARNAESMKYWKQYYNETYGKNERD